CALTGGSVSGNGYLAAIDFTFDHPYVGGLFLDLQNCQAADSNSVPIALAFCTYGTMQVNPLPTPVPMTMTPASTKIQALVGTTVTTDVVLGDASNPVIDLGGVEFNVAFDSTKLTLTNITAGPFLFDGIDDPLCFFAPPPTYFPEFGCVFLGKNMAPDGSGVMAHITFTVNAPFVGTTAVSLEDCSIGDEQGHPIAVTTCGGAVIEASPLPTPTQTPISVGGLSYDPPGAAPGGNGSSALMAIASAGALAFVAAAWLARRRTSAPDC
ncbi:MAG: cohesin domain-containing protein, partial [bacterium]